MIRELHDRNKSALLLVFEPSADGSYDLVDVPDAKLKCIATEDINQPRFAQLVASFGKRFARQAAAAKPPEGSMVGRLSGEIRRSDERLRAQGRSARHEPGRLQAEVCPLHARRPAGSCRFARDQPGDIRKAELHSEAWHRRAGIIHARVDHPHEDNSPTVAGVKTDLLLYQFVDGKLFRISAFFATDLFHVVSEAVIQKYGPPTRETKQPRELGWENNVSRIVLTRGTVHPRTPSTLHLVHKQLLKLASRGHRRARTIFSPPSGGERVLPRHSDVDDVADRWSLK